ncbi:MAG: EipA family protein [Pacificimonas sp.]
MMNMTARLIGLTLAGLAMTGCAALRGDSAPPPATASEQAQPNDGAVAASTEDGGDGFDEAAVLAAAEGTFGKGAKGLAKLIEDIVNDRGKPTAYIVGREGSGAVGVGLRYGAGTLYHKVEGERDVYWTGPSLGFDIGGDANRVFTLIYDLHDTQDLYRRYPAVEGKVYVVGGFTANYLQRDNIAVVPVKLGVGWRVGANVGYLNFTENRKILPF